MRIGDEAQPGAMLRPVAPALRANWAGSAPDADSGEYIRLRDGAGGKGNFPQELKTGLADRFHAMGQQ